MFCKELPLQRKQTTEREGKAVRRQTGMQVQEEGMVVRSCDGNLAAFYVMREKNLKIGRSIANTIRSLEVSVENEHAEIMRVGSKYYLRDMGTEAGTFIKIEGPRVLGEGTLVEMGSFLLEVRGVDPQARLLAIGVTHMASKGSCELTVALQDGCSSFSFGRRKNNDFAFDDEHLSGMHARIFLLHGQFVLEDLHSTNGYPPPYSGPGCV
jgi:pSer/pThr/pTyr-binding forkhead associated (FHA) protein